MEKKIDIQFDKDLDYFITLKGELVEAKILMDRKMDILDQYRGACYLLENYRYKYNNLSENTKKHLNVDISELEKLAVNVLVNQGHSNIVKEELLKEFGYSVKEEKK